MLAWCLASFVLGLFFHGSARFVCVTPLMTFSVYLSYLFAQWCCVSNLLGYALFILIEEKSRYAILRKIFRCSPNNTDDVRVRVLLPPTLSGRHHRYEPCRPSANPVPLPPPCLCFPPSSSPLYRDIVTMKFSAAVSLLFVASASAFTPASVGRVSYPRIRQILFLSIICSKS